MTEQQVKVEDSQRLPTMFSELPEFEFSRKERIEALREIQEIEREPVTMGNRAKVVGLIIKHGLIERYDKTEELSNTKKINSILNILSLDEKGEIDGREKSKWKEIYWNNVEYFYIANVILQDKLSEIDMEELIKSSADLRITPIRRFLFLYNLVSFYKNASLRNQEEMKKVLRESIKSFYENRS